VSNLILAVNKAPGYLLPAGSVMSAELLVDLRPQADCGAVIGAGWNRKNTGIAKQSARFEQHVRPVVTEGATGIPPSASRDALD
jgi:hypothetical protein